MSVTLIPAAGWVGIKANIGGLPVHQRCMLVVLDRDGNQFIVGSWTVPGPGQGSSTYNVDAGAAVTLDNVSAIRIQSFDNQVLLTTSA